MGIFFVDILDLEAKLGLGAVRHGAEVVRKRIEHLVGPFLGVGALPNQQEAYQDGKCSA